MTTYQPTQPTPMSEERLSELRRLDDRARDNALLLMGGRHYEMQDRDRAAGKALSDLLNEVERLRTSQQMWAQMTFEAIQRSHMWMDHVLTNAAEGNWDQLVEDVGDDLNNVDAVDEKSIELWDRAKKAAQATESLTRQRDELKAAGDELVKTVEEEVADWLDQYEPVRVWRRLTEEQGT